jgi:8-oxo-dGTP pyrophosphatase MutT (NUDIX family)
MEKPIWRRRSSTYLVDSPHMRLRVDELELPDGTVIPNYYVRESAGFVIVFGLTVERQVILVRQYRYGADAIDLELPAGTIDDGEDPRDCAIRELAEETGYEATLVEHLGSYRAEPARSTAFAHMYLATGARRTREPLLDPTEVIEVDLVDLASFRGMLRDGRIDNGASIATGYRAMERLDLLSS